ncbi:MAG TPA: tetratricopeptide repeat protein [Anaerolineales bacterium]|nr:tetratricopeptide repeat protein [Anaerolineales bacterium]HNA89034.1 tetratricopeptide repeat protein [Anaerolineales bacterium]HNB35937.1 tetratricopeptide repeat protein [Anaerolineales bacterium]HNC08266.1 tetratricopeptide repeat protein [Anaerolineales bacterium]
MNISPKRPIFRRRDETNIYRMFFFTVLTLGGIWLIRSVQVGDVKPLFLPTATPTRFAESYTLEGDALFTAGKLEDSTAPDGSIIPGAITAYEEATKVDPGNAEIWAQLARVQTYSTALIVNQEEIITRLDEAIASAEKAVEVNPDSSYAHAVLAFSMDWKASYVADVRDRQDLLTKSEQAAVRAQQLDNTNTLAQAFYAEVLVDQQKWTQAQQIIEQALAQDPSLMDVHRVHAYVLESLGEYALAIEAYDRAIVIAPNLTFLHLRAGAGYRRLAFESPNEDVQTQLFEKSLEYFARAASINEQLGVKDPVPYLSIAKTYSQMGQFFIAIRNVQKAIEFQPGKAEFYGELGVLYHKNRNYETGILALGCAIDGCTGPESCDARGECGANDVEAEVVGLPLNSTTVYYYDVFASELAALSTPRNDKCPDALRIAAIVEASEFIEDPNIAADMAVVRSICPLDTSGATTSPGSEPTPTATVESVPTP